MPAENLTRVEAEERAALVRPHSYEVSLDLTQGAETFHSVTTVHFDAVPGSSTFIDAITRTVHSVTLNGTSLNPSLVSDGVRIQLDDLDEHNVLIVDADAIYTNTGEGLHRFVDPVDGETYLYSQFEVPDSRRMFAVFEQPDLKATFIFTVTAPEHWTVVSNSPAPEPVEGANGTKTWSFAPTAVISSYITALIAGPYVGVHSELTSRDGRRIPLGIFTRASLAEFLDADYIFETTRKGFAFYEENFDYPYPFEKYDQLFVPEFNAGAMENAGAVTFTETYVFRAKVTDAIRERRVVTVLHELAHMWFGDLVTMKWWNDLWLNESFAEYASTLATAEATEWTQAWTTFSSMEKSWAYLQDQLPSTHPIVATINDLEDVQVNFDGITYAKGASVLRQLVAWVGQDAFMSGVARYFKKHEHGNTVLRDLLDELEAASGRELTSWSEKWLETAGVNTLRPEVTSDAHGTITSFAILQSAPSDHPTLRPHRLSIGFYNRQASKDTATSLIRTDRFELDIDGKRTDITEVIGLKRPDLILVNDDDLAYAKIRLDEESLRTAHTHLGQIASPLARSVVWGALWDATRDGEMSASSYVRLVLEHIASETESTTLRTTLNQLVLAASCYVAPERRNETRARAASRLWQLAQEAAPGSDAQFQFVLFFATLAHTNSQLATIEALRSHAFELDGLVIDADLTWQLLIALAAGGAVGNTEIDTALASDNTASGAQFAAQARASLPTPADKQAAWDSVFASDALPNTIVRFTAMGFQRVNEPDVLKPFISAYFAAVQDVWTSRTFQIAQYLVEDMYPAPLASVDLRDATQRWLDDNAQPVALRRLIVENLAGVERALVAQARDAEDVDVDLHPEY